MGAKLNAFWVNRLVATTAQLKIYVINKSLKCAISNCPVFITAVLASSLASLHLSSL
jgi:hypothetical protein